MAKETEIKIFEEKRYLSEAPRDGVLGIKNVDIHVGDLHVTGIAAVRGKTTIRHKRGSHTHYIYIAGEYGEKDLDGLAFKPDDEVRKALREFADKLEDELDQLPAEIHITVNPPRVEAKLLRRVDKEAFQRFATACKGLGMKYDPQSSAWIWRPPLPT
jgi:hypothetical protein